MELNVRVNPIHRITYIPKAVVNSLGVKLTIALDSRAALIYPTREDLEIVMASVRILLEALELKARAAAKFKEGTHTPRMDSTEDIYQPPGGREIHRHTRVRTSTHTTKPTSTLEAKQQ